MELIFITMVLYHVSENFTRVYFTHDEFYIILAFEKVTLLRDTEVRTIM